MPTSKQQKIKLLILYDLLTRHTDEDNPLSTQGIVDLLQSKHGVTVGSRALIEDIRLLNKYGYEVNSYKRKSHYFYVVDRPFELSELKVLIDAVQTASFIPEEKTKIFVDKIADLAGKHRSELLKKNIICYDTNKRSNKYVFYSVDTLISAIEGKKKASFLYYDLDISKNKVYRKSGNRYIVNPLSLLYTNDKYYLVCYSDKLLKLCNYRIDRMEQVEIEKSRVTPAPQYDNFNIHTYKQQAFSMFGGDLKSVRLKVDNTCIDAILDRFGENTPLKQIDNNTFSTTVKVQVSPTFFGWCLNSRGKIRISSPRDVEFAMDAYVKSVVGNADNNAVV
ncbi:MAG: WYL domain-containing protein [Firmicutes bacterium]|nr:WYL domain-containing protein [Bacillota bacterium]